MLVSSLSDAAGAGGSAPAVSIILPTYNRAKFLPAALTSMRSQAWQDWELIVIDDGSSDNTRELVAELTAGWEQPVQYVYQENQGAYGARNRGLDMARGDFLALYDSDDVWLPHHLSDCVTALRSNPDVDWVYGACRMVNLHSDQELAASTFYEGGRPRPCLRLRAESRGRLRVIDDRDAVRCQILHGLYCGLQNSVIRRRVFADYRFDAPLRNEAEDQVVVIWALTEGYRFAYFDNVHVIYHVHDANSSSASLSLTVSKKRRLQEAAIAGFERLSREAKLSARERRALARRLGSEYFWILGYTTHWMNGNRAEALKNFRQGLALWPWDWRCWKTYVVARLSLISPGEGEVSDGNGAAAGIEGRVVS